MKILKVLGAMVVLSLATALVFPNVHAAIAAAIDSAIGVEGLASPTLTVQQSGKGFNNTGRIPRVCDKAAPLNFAGVTANQVAVTGVAGQNIYVCGYQLAASVATTGTTIQFKEGTSGACTVGAANIGPPQFTMPTSAPTAANFSAINFTEFGLPFTVTAGDTLCLIFGSVANAITVTGTVWYTQGS